MWLALCFEKIEKAIALAVQAENDKAKELLENAILDLYNMYRKHNTMIFSTETDGLEHISKVHARAFREAELKRETPFDPEEKECRVRMEKEKSFAD